MGEFQIGPTHRTPDAEVEHHEHEEDGPDWSARHACQHVRIRHERQPGTLRRGRTWLKAPSKDARLRGSFTVPLIFTFRNYMDIFFFFFILLD